MELRILMVTNADVNSFRRSSFVHNCLQGLDYREAK